MKILNFEVKRIGQTRTSQFFQSLHYAVCHLAEISSEVRRVADALEVGNAISNEQKKLYSEFVENQRAAIDLQEQGLEMTRSNIEWTREQVNAVKGEFEADLGVKLKDGH